MRFLPAFLVDAVLVLVFAAIGRASHAEDPAGFLLTAWPFLVALLLGHAAAFLLPARPRRPWTLPWGGVVWAVTVVGGMLLRLLSGDTAELPFIIVATLVLGAFLLGWRGLTALVRRSRGRREPGAGAADLVDSAEGPDVGADPSPAEAEVDAETHTPPAEQAPDTDEQPRPGGTSA